MEMSGSQFLLLNKIHFSSESVTATGYCTSSDGHNNTNSVHPVLHALDSGYKR